MTALSRAVLVAAALFATGCMSHHTVRFADTDPLGWDPADAAIVKIANSDTTGLQDIMLIVRFDAAATIDSIPLRIATRTPGGDMVDESFTVKINHEAAAPGYLEAAAVYRKDARLGEEGDYTFTFYVSRPGIKGVCAVCVDLKPASKVD